jgi:hypothetical protein
MSKIIIFIYNSLIYQANKQTTRRTVRTYCLQQLFHCLCINARPDPGGSAPEALHVCLVVLDGVPLLRLYAAAHLVIVEAHTKGVLGGVQATPVGAAAGSGRGS